MIHPLADDRLYNEPWVRGHRRRRPRLVVLSIGFDTMPPTPVCAAPRPEAVQIEPEDSMPPGPSGGDQEYIA